MRDDTTRTRGPVADGADEEASTGPDSLFGDLSGAAREAVRSPADPRLDAHLARMGLADAPATTDAADATESREAAPAPKSRSRAAKRPVAAPPATPAELGAVPTMAAGADADARQTGLATEIDRLRAAVAAQETAGAELRDRIRQLGWLAGTGLVIAILALLLAIVR